MGLARFFELVRRRGTGAAAVLLAALVQAPGAGAAKCDYSGFERPCTVQDGEYRALIPDGASAGESAGGGPFPAMVYLHGSGGRSVTIASHPMFEAAVVARGHALIVPAARLMTYAGGVRDTGWSLRHEPDPVRDEVAFLRAVIEDATRRFPLDRGRILLAGQSRGGFLVWEIACHEPDLASAYAVHGASYLGPPPERCRRPVRFLHTGGRADQLVPAGGRPAFSGGAGMAPMHEALDLMARANGCAQEPGEPRPWLGFTRQSWSGCAPGSRLDLLLHDGGHHMPAHWFRAVLDWFDEPLPEAPQGAPVVRRIGEGLPGTGAEATGASRFKAPPAPGTPALSPD